MKNEVIGIDLGTTFSAVARVEGGRSVIVRNSLGKATTPSVIYFPGAGESPVVGEAAKLMQEAGERDIACAFKRRMGKPQNETHYHGKAYAAKELSAILLRCLLKETLGPEVRPRAVITVPAYFDNRGRTDTIQAGEAAGIDVLGIVNEPTAAAIAFGLRGDQWERTALVYDLGGGTFDVTIVRIGASEVQVLGSDGDHELGGKDWDDRLARYVAGEFQSAYDSDPLEDPLTSLALAVRCEIAKQQLSARAKTRVSVSLGGHRADVEITREAFEVLSRDLVDRTIARTEHALADLKLGWKDIDEVVPVGGSTRMPMILQAIRERFEGKIATGVDPDEAVALGAAIEAERRVCSTPYMGLAASIRVQDVMAHSLGMVAENADRSRYINSVIIPKNTPIPCQKLRNFQQRTRRTGQSETEVYVVQGEVERPLDCTLLGRYVISGIEPEPNGAAVLVISYSYDANGVVQVTARQKSTERELLVRVEPLPDDLAWLDKDPRECDVSEIEHLSVYLAIDLSGSMSGKPLQRAQDAARGFVRELDLKHSSIGLNIFADSSSTTVELTQSQRKLIRGIDQWRIGEVGYGNSVHPFDDLHRRLTKVDGRRFVVVLTDGVWYNRESAVHAAKKLKDDGVEIVAMGFGGADHEFLKELANSDEGALFTQLSDLGAQFSRIAQVMSDAQTGGLAMKKGSRGLSFFGGKR